MSSLSLTSAPERTFLTSLSGQLPPLLCDILESPRILKTGSDMISERSRFHCLRVKTDYEVEVSKYLNRFYGVVMKSCVDTSVLAKHLYPKLASRCVSPASSDGDDDEEIELGYMAMHLLSVEMPDFEEYDWYNTPDAKMITRECF